MGSKVVVYSLDGCKYCAMLEAWLGRMGIPFEKRPPEAKDTTVPRTVIDGVTLMGFNDQIKNELLLRFAP